MSGKNVFVYVALFFAAASLLLVNNASANPNCAGPGCPCPIAPGVGTFAQSSYSYGYPLLAGCFSWGNGDTGNNWDTNPYPLYPTADSGIMCVSTSPSTISETGPFNQPPYGCPNALTSAISPGTSVYIRYIGGCTDNVGSNGNGNCAAGSYGVGDILSVYICGPTQYCENTPNLAITDSPGGNSCPTSSGWCTSTWNNENGNEGLCPGFASGQNDNGGNAAPVTISGLSDTPCVVVTNDQSPCGSNNYCSVPDYSHNGAEITFASTAPRGVYVVCGFEFNSGDPTPGSDYGYVDEAVCSTIDVNGPTSTNPTPLVYTPVPPTFTIGSNMLIPGAGLMINFTYPIPYGGAQSQDFNICPNVSLEIAKGTQCDPGMLLKPMPTTTPSSALLPYCSQYNNCNAGTCTQYQNGYNGGLNNNPGGKYYNTQYPWPNCLASYGMVYNTIQPSIFNCTADYIANFTYLVPGNYTVCALASEYQQNETVAAPGYPSEVYLNFTVSGNVVLGPSFGMQITGSGTSAASTFSSSGGLSNLEVQTPIWAYSNYAIPPATANFMGGSYPSHGLLSWQEQSVYEGCAGGSTNPYTGNCIVELATMQSGCVPPISVEPGSPGTPITSQPPSVTYLPFCSSASGYFPCVLSTSSPSTSIPGGLLQGDQDYAVCAYAYANHIAYPISSSGGTLWTQGDTNPSPEFQFWNCSSGGGCGSQPGLSGFPGNTNSTGYDALAFASANIICVAGSCTLTPGYQETPDRSPGLTGGFASTLLGQIFITNPTNPSQSSYIKTGDGVYITFNSYQVPQSSPMKLYEFPYASTTFNGFQNACSTALSTDPSAATTRCGSTMPPSSPGDTSGCYISVTAPSSALSGPTTLNPIGGPWAFPSGTPASTCEPYSDLMPGCVSPPGGPCGSTTCGSGYSCQNNACVAWTGAASYCSSSSYASGDACSISYSTTPVLPPATGSLRLLFCGYTGSQLSAGAFAIVTPTGIAPPPPNAGQASISPLNFELCSTFNTIGDVFFALALIIVILGAVLYTGSYFLPASSRGGIQSYGLGMLTGGLVAVGITFAASGATALATNTPITSLLFGCATT